MSTKTKNASVDMPNDVNTTGATTYSSDTAPIGSKAPSLLDIINNMKSSSRLDAAALDYIDEIDRIFKDGHEPISSLPIATDKIEARAYIHEPSRYAIVLLFAESHQAIDMTPPAARVNSVIEALAARKSDVMVVQSIVVCKEDYVLASKMAAFISNAFQTVSGGIATHLNVDNLKNIRISVVTAIDKVRDYVRSVSPHAVPDRDDIGIMLCLEVENKKTGFQREVELRPFLAITGYTKVMNPQDSGTGTKFVPIPTITNVISSIPNSALLSMALPMAADAFIIQGLWVRPYASFRTGCPNLGNLIVDPTSKKPLFTDTNEAFHMFTTQYMTAPFLAIDVTEGRARPLGIDSLVTNPERVMNNIRAFFNAPNIEFGQNNGRLMMFSNYTGSYVDAGSVKDTRYVDYLELACKMTNHKEIEDLLMQPNQPHVRIERVRSIYTENTKSLYITTTVVLDANAIGCMHQAINKNEIKLQYDMPASGNISLNQMIHSVGGNAYGFQSIGYGFGPQSFVQVTHNPYANIFG